MLRLLLGAKPVYFFVCAKAHDRAYSQDACMLPHAAAFAWRKTRLFFVCAKAHDRAYSPDRSLGVAGTAMSVSEGRIAGNSEICFL